jgi:8-oxo-dGTP diphosphatase
MDLEVHDAAHGLLLARRRNAGRYLPAVRPPRLHVRAAGGVIVRDGRVALVHRPKYDDWSLPKGKLDAGEGWEEAALREVLEETGIACRLRAEIGSARYLDRKGRPKTVRYWAMEPDGPGEFRVNSEVDELRWVSAAEAAALLSYPRDRDIVERAFAALGE